MEPNTLGDLDTKCDIKTCTKPATHVMVVHQIDHCKEKGMPPSGCKVFYFCRTCNDGIATIIAARYEAMKDAVAERNEKLTCKTCHLEISRLSVMLDIEHLRPESSMVPTVLGIG